MHRARVIGAAVLMAVGLIAVWAQPASATVTVWQNQAWHQGRMWYDFWQAGSPHIPGCTTGPQFYASNGKFYMATPLHCLTVGGTFPGHPYWGVYENDPNNKHGSGNIVLPPAPYSGYDMALVELGANPAAKSDYIFDYCNPAQTWNCTSYFGFGALANQNWAGHWRQTVGWYPGAISTGASAAKSGSHGGTAWGTVTGSRDFGPGTGYAYTYSLNNCGAAVGDSGSPVFARSGDDYAYTMGMHIGHVLSSGAVAGAGNACYAQGTSYYLVGVFYSVDQIKVVFDPVVGALTPW